MTLVLHRDAGTFVLNGELREGRGAGHFTFTARPGYVSEMKAMGYDMDDENLLSAAVHDVSNAFVRVLDSAGYKTLPLDDLLAFRIHGVSLSFIREVQRLGYEKLLARDLIAFKVHGVTPDYLDTPPRVPPHSVAGF